MARGINKVILVGNLGNDPEVRYSQSGSAMTTISIATSESWKDKATGEQKERTEWHRVKFFGKLAEIAGEYLKKGSQVYVEGRLRTDKYTDKNGVERYTTDVFADDMQMLGGKMSGGEGGGSSRPMGGGAPRSSGGGGGGYGGGSNESRGGGSNQMPPSRNDDPFPEDDIPF